ncbi:MAG TPA: DNA ligase D [Cytophagales bacterium]|nr:DNA ligase D [Cytophagales bacterium]
MALQKYKEKRNFENTPEPEASKSDGKGALKFVIQRHDASRLHYDFRLEMEGVLKSWAVPKGPSLNPKDKRLAMMVEDHPFSYRTFEGEIPKGNYGAGIVEIWDEGTYHALDTKDRKLSEETLLDQLEKGSLKFVLHGKKLKGEFALVKIHNREDVENAWLLIKHKDEFATDTDYDSEDHVSPNSKIIKKKKGSKANSKTGKQREEVAKMQHTKSSSQVPETLKGKDPMPRDVKPMLAKLVDAPFDEEGWIFEIKWDGYRAIAEIEGDAVKLYSRNNIPFRKYPSLISELKSFGHNVVLDGEVVVLDETGKSSFQGLQNIAENPTPNLFYYVFDILYLNGYDLRGLPLTERKKFLKEIFPELEHIKYSDHVEAKGIDFFELAKKQHLEGIIAKKADAPYRIGLRSDKWLKVKIGKRQEAVICGFTAPRGSRKGFGALVLGVYEKGKLVYVGHTGGGFNEQSIKAVKSQLDKLVQDKSPFQEKVKTNEKVTWVKPQLICEVAFAEWTGDMHMRQPIFQGMRTDKKPEEVLRETVNLEVSPGAAQDAGTKTTSGKGSKTTTKSQPKAAAKEKTVKNVEPRVNIEEKQQEIKSNGHTIKLSNLQKVYWPEEGYTKGDLIAYYQKVAPYIMPYLVDRPESLNRHPNGIDQDNFFQKDMGDKLPSWIKTVEIFSESNNKNINYLVCQDADTLMYINNLGCIEINTWHSRIQSLAYPDYCLIDLDPGENTFEEVIETALVTKDILDRAQITAYCKTSGATGMHIIIPLGAKYDFDQSKDFAHIIVQMVHEKLPELTSLERSPKARRKQIYLDYLQNRTGQTVAVPYSVRPKPGATVSTPLEWHEVKPGLHPSQFDIHNIHARIQQKGDLFKAVLGEGIDMNACLQRLSEL